jgi:hypothetical protein
VVLFISLFSVNIKHRAWVGNMNKSKVGGLYVGYQMQQIPTWQKKKYKN